MSSPHLHLLGCAASILLAGCVERELVVHTQPPGARVYVDGVDRGDAGAQGLAVPFEHYGTREVVVRLAGHEPARRMVELEAPWWQAFPLDLVTDVLWPGTIHDDHEVTLELAQRADPPAPAALEARARAAGGSDVE